MKIRNLTFIFSILLIASQALAQSWESIKTSPLYLYGEGWAVAVEDADQAALSDLISKISIQVKAEITHNEEETVTSEGVDSRTSFNAMINTYSSATLTNTEKIILENEPNAHVGRYIRRADVNRIFELRKDKINDYIAAGLKAEERGKLDVALKNLYWAHKLTQTLPQPDEFRHTDDSGKSYVASKWLIDHINELLDEVKVNFVNRVGDDVELRITFRGKPVNSIDYTYFDGRDWSSTYSAKDGLGVLELAPGALDDNLQLKIEYEFKREVSMDNDVRLAFASVPNVYLRGSRKDVKGSAKPAKPSSPAKPSKKEESPLADSFAKISESYYHKPEPIADNSEYMAIVDKLGAAIAAKRYTDASVAALFTPGAKKIYDELIHYGSAQIVGKPEYTFYKYGDNVICRGLKMAFSFKNGVRKKFIEDVVFSFNTEGKIDNITFGLGKTAEDDILGKGLWDENSRFALMTFMENYQTAFALRRLDYIESIFDDYAVIFTTVVHPACTRKTDSDGVFIEARDELIKVNKYTKSEYIRKLRKNFAGKEYINLVFSDNEIKKLSKYGEVYAVQISQEYYSSNYSDKGYLMLIIDLNDKNEPLIKVRSWQQEKDPEFGIFGPEMLK